MSKTLTEGLQTEISVRAPARLHLGFLDLNASIGRKFGSIGLAVNSHYTHIKLRLAEATTISGQLNEECEQKLLKTLALFYQTAGKHIPINQQSVDINVVERIPQHSGLGSGTQLALVLGAALAELHQLDISTPELALILERGKRSGIGIATFDSGGFIVDGGVAPSQTAPPTLMRYPFPEEWRVILLMSLEHQGIHGQSEKSAFKTLPTFPLENAQAICHLTLMQLLPALVERNINQFGAAVTEIQALIGDHFAPMQGGRYTSDAVASCLQFAHSLGHMGIAQSSWGPTGCIFVKDDETADELIIQLEQFIHEQQSSSEKLTLIKVEADNHGAVIESRVEVSL